MILMDETGIALCRYIMNSQRIGLRESLVTWYKLMFLFAGMLSSLPTV